MPSRTATANTLNTSSACGPSRCAPRIRPVSSAISTLNRGVAPRVDRRVRDALEKLVYADATLLALDAGGGKIEVVDLRHSSGAMDGHVDFEPSFRAALGGAHHEPLGVHRDAADLGVQLDADPDVSRALHEHVDQVRVEGFQWTAAAMDDRDARAGARGDVSELERDVATADERHPSRQ